MNLYSSPRTGLNGGKMSVTVLYNELLGSRDSRDAHYVVEFKQLQRMILRLHVTLFMKTTVVCNSVYDDRECLNCFSWISLLFVTQLTKITTLCNVVYEHHIYLPCCLNESPFSVMVFVKKISYPVIMLVTDYEVDQCVSCDISNQISINDVINPHRIQNRNSVGIPATWCGVPGLKHVRLKWQTLQRGWICDGQQGRHYCHKCFKFNK